MPDPLSAEGALAAPPARRQRVQDSGAASTSRMHAAPQAPQPPASSPATATASSWWPPGVPRAQLAMHLLGGLVMTLAQLAITRHIWRTTHDARLLLPTVLLTALKAAMLGGALRYPGVYWANRCGGQTRAR